MGFITGQRPDLVSGGDNNPHEGAVGSCANMQRWLTGNWARQTPILIRASSHCRRLDFWAISADPVW
jgi:hypothetical protein